MLVWLARAARPKRTKTMSDPAIKSSDGQVQYGLSDGTTDIEVHLHGVRFIGGQLFIPYGVCVVATDDHQTQIPQRRPARPEEARAMNYWIWKSISELSLYFSAIALAVAIGCWAICRQERKRLEKVVGELYCNATFAEICSRELRAIAKRKRLKKPAP